MTIDGTEWIPKSEAPSLAKEIDGLPCVLIRSADSGVHVGYMESKVGGEVTLVNSRRIYYWDGAATLSQLSQDGVSKPDNCKFPAAIPQITVLGVCEIIPVTEAAWESISNVKEWKQ